MPPFSQEFDGEMHVAALSVNGDAELAPSDCDEHL